MEPLCSGRLDQGVEERVTWKVHREIVLLLGWGRAILMQLSHPLVARGVIDHSRFRATPRDQWRRLGRTLDAMLTLTFGTINDIERVTRGLNAVHERVYGCLAEPAGAFTTGTTYTAHDPALQRWVHSTVVDSFLKTYELYVGPLSREVRDRYCREAGENASLLGIPSGDLPRTAGALEQYIQEMLASGEIVVTDAARTLAREIVTPPIPWAVRPLLPLVQLPTIGLLPPSIREGYGFRWDSRRETALRLSAGMLRNLLPLTPSVLRYWPTARAAIRRRREH